MSPGIRATVEFDDPTVCPIADLATSAQAPVESVTTSVSVGDEPAVTEFSLDTGEPAADVGETPAEPIFSHGSRTRYRLTHDDGISCPCECLGSHGCAVARYHARDGRLTVVFHAADYEDLRSVVADLRERFPGIDIKRFVRGPAEERTRDPVLVDRGRLTARQSEVLETAYEMGYFERPRGANATEIADELGITPSTLSEHLTAAQSKLLEELF